MGQLKDYFYISTSDDRMLAYINGTDKSNSLDQEITEDAMLELLKDNQITYGVNSSVIQLILTNIDEEKSPLIIAKGKPVQHGTDGDINYFFDSNTDIDKTTNWSFRDVMRIPSVQQGQRLATLVLPTHGEDGMDVYGKIVQPKPGKPYMIKAGKM
ncbi:flagellar assembly protein A [Virgibacillus byunsanensis]|uniref:Flagellar assembly protein A n=1 Tax=Virgibacillus byunsanensis TaxID=570945 RepID=A0ABW3LKY9_9BACI